MGKDIHVSSAPAVRAEKGLGRGAQLRPAGGALLAWTDDDCRLSADYVRDLLRHDAADTELVLRGGRVERGDPSDLPITVKTSSRSECWRRKLNSTRHGNIGDCVLGCNMTMHREVIDRVGPFDWRFSTTDIPAGEDADYIYRAYLAGVRIEYVPDMGVLHCHVRKTAAEGNKLFRNYMIGVGALYAKHFIRHPNFCRPLYWDSKNAVKEVFKGTHAFFSSI